MTDHDEDSSLARCIDVALAGILNGASANSAGRGAIQMSSAGGNQEIHTIVRQPYMTMIPKCL